MNFEPLLQRPLQPAIAEAARYFQEISADVDLPMRRDFRPSRLRASLGFMFMVDVLPGDYRWDVMGEHIAVLFGINDTSALLSGIHPKELRDRLTKTYDDVVASRSFHYIRGHYTWHDKSVAIERLLVPMADQDGRLNAILGISVPVDIPTNALAAFAGIGPAKLEIEMSFPSSAVAA